VHELVMLQFIRPVMTVLLWLSGVVMRLHGADGAVLRRDGQLASSPTVELDMLTCRRDGELTMPSVKG
jgi:hypothetical protein